LEHKTLLGFVRDKIFNNGGDKKEVLDDIQYHRYITMKTMIILLLFDRRGMASFVNNFLYELCKMIKLLYAG